MTPPARIEDSNFECLNVYVWQADQPKLMMTVSADGINADLKIRFDRKPVSPNEWDLITELKKQGFTWQGFGESGKWQAGKEAITAFDDLHAKVPSVPGAKADARSWIAI